MSTIKLKRSSTSTAIPSTVDLELGELALNVADGKIFLKRSNNDIVAFGALSDLLDVNVTPTDGQLLSWDATNSYWTAVEPGASYTDADVDTHLNTSTAASGEVLSWNGSDYDWITGGGSSGAIDDIFYENSTTVSSDYTITSSKNAVSAGPIAIADGVTVTVPSGSRWSIV